MIAPEVRAEVAPLRERHGHAIWDALARYGPDGHLGEDIALRVLQDLGEEALRADTPIAASHLNSLLNRLIGCLLVDRFGAGRVAMKWASPTQPALMQGVVGQTRVVYVAFRVAPANEAKLRVALDWSVLRKLAEGDQDAIDVDAIALATDPPLVSVTDGATLELLDDLLNGSLPFDLWRGAAAKVAKILDPEMPTVPGGWELAALSGTGPARADMEERARHRKRVWAALVVVRDRRDLTRVRRYWPGDGTVVEDQIMPDRVTADLIEVERRYADYFAHVAPLAEGETRDEVTLRILGGLARTMGVADVVRLDLAARYIADRVVATHRRSGPYKPKRNDAIDLELLFTLPLPALVCTSDMRFLNIVRGLGSEQSWMVVTPAELLRIVTEQAAAL